MEECSEITAGDLKDFLANLLDNARIVQWGHLYHRYKNLEDFIVYYEDLNEIHI